MLDEGESLLATVGGVPPDWWITSEDGASVTVDRADEIFYNDCSPEDAAEAADQLAPQLRESFVQPIRSVVWRGVPTTYVVCDRDNAIPVFAQEHLGQRAGEVLRIDASHSPFLSRPGEVVALIADRAG